VTANNAMHRSGGLVPLLAVLFLAAAAAAQTPAAPTPAAPARPSSAAAAAQLRPSSVPLAATADSRREARALGEMLQYPARAHNALVQLRERMVGAVAQRMGKPPSEAASIVDDILMPDFKDAEAKIAGILVENLAAGFTASDLVQIRTFFSSPVGQRWIQSIQAVERDDVRQIQILMQDAFQQAIARHRDELRARGVNF
jgi:uncharacterized protein